MKGADHYFYKFKKEQTEMNDKKFLQGLAVGALIAFMISIGVALSGCAAINLDTPEKAYLAARDEFNTMLGQYLIHYQDGTTEQQAAWKGTIDPQFEKGNTILDTWALAVKMHADPAAHEQEFLDLKNKLIDALADM